MSESNTHIAREAYNYSCVCVPACVRVHRLSGVHRAQRTRKLIINARTQNKYSYIVRINIDEVTLGVCNRPSCICSAHYAYAVHLPGYVHTNSA